MVDRVTLNLLLKGIDSSPFKASFGKAPPIGLKTIYNNKVLDVMMKNVLIF
jgi:hypothetical protein